MVTMIKSLMSAWLAAIRWKQRHTCDIPVAICMLVSACMAVEFVELAEDRYTVINNEYRTTDRS